MSNSVTYKEILQVLVEQLVEVGMSDTAIEMIVMRLQADKVLLADLVLWIDDNNPTKEQIFSQVTFIESQIEYDG